MKGKPSDYLSDNGDGHRRFLKPGDVPAPGGSFVITEIEGIEQVNRFTGKPERLIRLGLDSDWLFDLKGRNLKTTIELLGDSFDGWLNKRLNFRVSSFMAVYGEMRLGWDRDRADRHARTFWEPNRTWQQFVTDCRSRYLEPE